METDLDLASLDFSNIDVMNTSGGYEIIEMDGLYNSCLILNSLFKIYTIHRNDNKFI